MLRRFLFRRETGSQYRIHPRLPAGALSLETVDDILVEAQTQCDLVGCRFGRPCTCHLIAASYWKQENFLHEADWVDIDLHAQIAGYLLG